MIFGDTMGKLALERRAEARRCGNGAAANVAPWLDAYALSVHSAVSLIAGGWPGAAAAASLATAVRAEGENGGFERESILAASGQQPLRALADGR